MKLNEVVERRHPSYYTFDEVMDLYSRMEMLYSDDGEDTPEGNLELENLKGIYARTDPEVRREVELTYNSKDPDMGQADRY